MKDPKEVAKRGMEAFIYTFGYAVDENNENVLSKFTSHHESMDILSNLGFKVPGAEREVCKNIEEVIKKCENWQIQRDTGNAYFNNVTARGSLITGNVSAQRIEINKTLTPGTATAQPIGTNRIEAFRSDNIRFLTIGGSGGYTRDTAVIGISANENISNPVWIESSSPDGSGILSNTLSTANAISAISTGGGRLFYGAVNDTSNPVEAIRIDLNTKDTPRTTNGIAVNMSNATGSAFAAAGNGDGYAFDAVTGTSGAANSKSGIGYFRGIDFPTTAGVITVTGTQARMVVNVNNLTTVGDLTFTIILEGITYQFVLGYNSEYLNSMAQFVTAISTNINNACLVSSSGTLASGSFIFTNSVVGELTGELVAIFTSHTDKIHGTLIHILFFIGNIFFRF
jgi:hypothetical protein